MQAENGNSMNKNDALITLLQKSHVQAMAGDTVPMNEVESFMQNKIYELTHSVDTCCVAESL